eukprot:scaffold23160_cov107-Isochrysis_galbana.AAC.4
MNVSQCGVCGGVWHVWVWDSVRVLVWVWVPSAGHVAARSGSAPRPFAFLPLCLCAFDDGIRTQAKNKT